MATNHDTTQACPICTEDTVRQVRCSNVECSFVVTTCTRCDRGQAVAAFVADHEKDCVHEPSAFFPDSRRATFAAPHAGRRAG